MSRLSEPITFDDGAKFVEEDGARDVKNVAMLGGKSSHGYEYEQLAMAKAVTNGLYENVRIFINHGEGSRDVMHLAGVFKNTRHEGGKVRGDAHLLDDDYGRKFWLIAKTMPEAAGCSHVADGRLVSKAGKQVVEEITKVYSVDLVVQGATTKSVFEGDSNHHDAARVAAEALDTFFAEQTAVTTASLSREPTQEEIEGAMWPFGRPAEAGITVEGGRNPPERRLDEQLQAFDALLEQGRALLPISGHPNISSSERNMMETLNERITRRADALDKIRTEAARLCDPAYENIVHEEVQEEQHREYEERQKVARENERLLETTLCTLSLSPGRETDAEFTARMRERRETREQCELGAARIAEESLAGTVGGSGILRAEFVR